MESVVEEKDAKIGELVAKYQKTEKSKKKIFEQNFSKIIDKDKQISKLTIEIDSLKDKTSHQEEVISGLQSQIRDILSLESTLLPKKYNSNISRSIAPERGGEQGVVDSGEGVLSSGIFSIT